MCLHVHVTHTHTHTSLGHDAIYGVYRSFRVYAHEGQQETVQQVPSLICIPKGTAIFKISSKTVLGWRWSTPQKVSHRFLSCFLYALFGRWAFPKVVCWLPEPAHSSILIKARIVKKRKKSLGWNQWTASMKILRSVWVIYTKSSTGVRRVMYVNWHVRIIGVQCLRRTKPAPH